MNLVFEKVKFLWPQLSRKRKVQLVAVGILTFVVSIIELFAISAVIPLLTIALDGNSFSGNLHLFSHFFKLLSVPEDEVLLWITVIFANLIFFSCAIRILTVYLTSITAHAVGADLSVLILSKILHADRRTMRSMSGSDVVSLISAKSIGIVAYFLTPLLELVSAFSILILLLPFALLLNPSLSLIGGIVVGLSYVATLSLTRKKLRNNGHIISELNNEITKDIEDTIGAITDIKIRQLEKAQKRLFAHHCYKLRRAQGLNEFLISSPRIAIEAVLFLTMAAFIFFIGLQGNFKDQLPTLVALALIVQRSMPYAQKIYFALGSLNSGKAVVDDLFAPLSFVSDPIKFSKIRTRSGESQSITLDNVSFSHREDGAVVFSETSTNFEFGKMIGISGPSGSGKSTLMDLLMGFYQPSSGAIWFGNELLAGANIGKYQQRMSYVPQAVYLSNTSIKQNVEFLLEENIKPTQQHELEASSQLSQALLGAGLSSFVNSLPNGVASPVGYRGNQLSGGQIQRLGIARALYRKSDILFFDEFTSALDEKTEDIILDELMQLKGTRTIFLFGHKKRTFRNCDEIYEIKDRNLTQN